MKSMKSNKFYKFDIPPKVVRHPLFITPYSQNFFLSFYKIFVQNILRDHSSRILLQKIWYCLKNVG